MRHTLKSSLLLIVIIVLAGGCNKDLDVVNLNPDAGNSFLDIENDGYVISLNAVAPPEGQQGTWRVYVGENGFFEDLNNPNSNFYGEPGENYVLGWEVSEGDEYKSESINVSFKPLNPVIISVVNDTMHNNTSLYLEADAPQNGAKGKWTIVEGDQAQIVNADQHEAEFLGAEFKDYTVRWTLTYGSREVFTEIQFVTGQLQAYAGEDNLDIKTSKTADTKFFTLEGFLPAGASGIWNVIDGQQGIVHSNNIDNSLFEGVADTSYTLTWTVNLNGTVSVDTVNLRFRGLWGMFTDVRDGQNYRFAEVNGLEWMADNFNYAVEPGYGSWYYGHGERSIIGEGHALEDEEERKYYGRLYDWHTAYNYAPEGWRLPSYDEFDALIVSLGGPIYADKRIKEGGDTGLELTFPGYLNLSDPSDQAFRNMFRGQDISGLYWLNEYIEANGYAAVFEVTSTTDKPTTGGLPTTFYKIPVRYVRDVQN